MTIQWWHIAIGVAGLGGAGWLVSRAGLLSMFKNRQAHRTQKQIKKDLKELDSDYADKQDENADGRAADHAGVDDWLSTNRPK